jgi:hypothetical protein
MHGPMKVKLKTPPHTTYTVCITGFNLLTLVREIISVCGYDRHNNIKHCVSQLHIVAMLQQMEYNYNSDLNG